MMIAYIGGYIRCVWGTRIDAYTKRLCVGDIKTNSVCKHQPYKTIGC